MPATEKTWRDMKLMHTVFGVSSLVLLIATVWMFAADHMREWKGHQRSFRTVERKLGNWRRESRAGEIRQKKDELETKLTELAGVQPPQPLLDQFKESVDADAQRRGVSPPSSIDPSNLDKLVKEARFREDRALTDRKFMAAQFDVAKANRGLAVRDGWLEDKSRAADLAKVDQRIEDVRNELDRLTEQYQQASEHRKKLQALFQQMYAEKDGVQRDLKDVQAEVARLDAAVFDNTSTYFMSRPPFLGKKWLELPILDAFNSPLKIQNLWTEGLTMPNGSFGQVRRFDRCTTCHEAIDKTQAGSAVEPLFEGQHEVVVRLMTPAEAPAGDSSSGQPAEQTLESVYGIILAEQGLLDRDDVTVRGVVPASPAALAEAISGKAAGDIGLQPGDIVTYVGGDKVLSNGELKEFLLQNISWGKPVELTVLRGLPHPYASHPRLDLFVGSLSPHTLAGIGCTVCHEGQGSGTEFKWTSHTPNDPEQRGQWRSEYGWFNNHHWIFPMLPARFSEAGCLKCHHEVVELYPSQRFPEAPAPKLVQGFELISEYGCFGCHEINGYKSKDQRIGPDLRLEPNFHEVAAALQSDPGFAKLSPQVQQLARDLVHHPDRDAERNQLRQAVLDDKKSESPVLTARSHGLADQNLADVETPGKLRKVGPSLRHVAEKAGPTFLFDWIRDPKHFRPSTRMPKFFGNYDHLEAGAEREMVERFEQAEILGIVAYLLNSSQPTESLPASAVIPTAVDAKMAERGKVLFETRGCLACHQHGDFPAGKATQGPDLTNVGDKLTAADSPSGLKWLYTWLKDPNLYHARTKMPNLILEPIRQADGSVTDPAADIAAYLLASRQGWQPTAETQQAVPLLTAQPSAAAGPLPQALKELTLEHLKKVFTIDEAQLYIEKGVPESLSPTLKGAEIELVGGASTPQMLKYVGRKAIAKYGCYACHDIPGFEDAKPIGTALADWGRKESAKLAFEHIMEYVGHGHGGHAGGDHGAEATGMEPAAEPFDEGFYHQALMDQERSGFAWQKLKEPRSYDYQKYGADKTTFNDRLRMPLFPFNAQQREAVLTFVLGLVAEPPADKFVYRPDARRQTINAGRVVLEKYNCGGCHILEPERWDLEFASGTIEPQSEVVTFPFLQTRFTPEEIAKSLVKHPVRGTLHATLFGLPGISDEEAKPLVWEDIGLPIADPVETYDPSTLFYPFELWQPTLIEGNTFEMGVNLVPVPASTVHRKFPGLGGDLTRLLLPRVLELERTSNPQAKGTEAWGWLPPPLMGQGNKVQTGWLHDFLLDPHPIRPAVFLRMPKFNMSSAEASQLVNYFAARDNAEFPYSFDSRTREAHLSASAQSYAKALAEVPADQRPRGNTRLDHAMNIVVDSTYCIKCHLVGDFAPEGSDRAKAPNLVEIQRRLRPDYLRNWIANPKRILPYTPMPENIKYDPEAENLGGVSQQLFHGTSVEQLDGLVDLLMNYSRFTAEQTKVAPLVKAAAQQAAAAGGAAGSGSASGADGSTEGNDQ